jgi:hypothetical protein
LREGAGLGVIKAADAVAVSGLVEGPASRITLQEAMGFRTTDVFEPLPSVEGAHRIPVQMLEPDRQRQPIGDRKAMCENPGAGPLALILREQIELAKAQMIRLPLKRKCPEALAHAPYCQEWLLAVAAPVQRALQVLIPPPTPDDVRPHGRSFRFERKRKIIGIAAKPNESQIRRKVGQVHATTPLPNMPANTGFTCLRPDATNFKAFHRTGAHWLHLKRIRHDTPGHASGRADG